MRTTDVAASGHELLTSPPSGLARGGARGGGRSRNCRQDATPSLADLRYRCAELNAEIDAHLTTLEKR